MVPKLQEVARAQGQDSAALRERRAQGLIAAESDAMELASEKVRRALAALGGGIMGDARAACGLRCVQAALLADA